MRGDQELVGETSGAGGERFAGEPPAPMSMIFIMLIKQLKIYIYKKEGGLSLWEEETGKLQIHHKTTPDEEIQLATSTSC